MADDDNDKAEADIPTVCAPKELPTAGVMGGTVGGATEGDELTDFLYSVRKNLDTHDD